MDKKNNKKQKQQPVITSCDTCAYYAYDDEYDYYVCEMDLDEDEAYKFMTSSSFSCPFYRNGDEYAVVKHQAF